MSSVTIGSATHVGMKRKENQDYHGYFPPEEGLRHKKGLLIALADGMGGHAGGAVASRTAIEVLMEEYYKDAEADIFDSLENAFLKANESVHEKGKSDDERFHGMGSTLTAVVIKGSRLYYAHVGDSRGYLVEEGKIKQFTDDHSYVAGLLRAGAITPEEAETHPDSNIITRAIGIKEDVVVDVVEDPICLRKGQYIILCCDGLWGQVPDETILELVLQHKEPDIICTHLIEAANESGGPDNISVIAVRIDKVNMIASLFDRCTNLMR